MRMTRMRVHVVARKFMVRHSLQLTYRDALPLQSGPSGKAIIAPNS